MAENRANFAELLKEAVTRPGLISAAYGAFHGYSLGNMLLALIQCRARGIEPGPINTYAGWKALGRHVMKGQKAITLCMPVTRTRTETDETTGDEKKVTFTQFIYKRNWFVMSQTDGRDCDEQLRKAPEFDFEAALESLNISRVAFTGLDGNAQGFARRREIAINPVAANPRKTFFHEIAHVLLGHTEKAECSDDEQLSVNEREMEAECTALLCIESLGLDGAEYSRAYIQGWYGRNEIPEKSARRIMRTADDILKAGTGAGNQDARRAA
jgi:antirestriction protein ArdC